MVSIKMSQDKYIIKTANLNKNFGSINAVDDLTFKVEYSENWFNL